jgi:hypothetical protein
MIAFMTFSRLLLRTAPLPSDEGETLRAVRPLKKTVPETRRPSRTFPARSGPLRLMPLKNKDFINKIVRRGKENHPAGYGLPADGIPASRPFFPFQPVFH